MMRVVLVALALALAVWGVFAPQGALAQGFSALARVDAARSDYSAGRGGAELSLTLSQPVPYRVYTLTDPARLVLDFREVDFTGFDALAFAGEGLRVGRFQPGWSRMVLEMDEPMVIGTAGMVTGAADGTVRIDVTLEAASAEVFAQQSGPPPGSRSFPDPASALAPPPRRVLDPDRPLRVVLDPGHGGIDPGAVREGVNEADLMLSFARQMREEFARSGDYEVFLTRDEDVFVSLEGRIALTHRLRADVFISLHADAIAEGVARGAQVYTLSEEASSAASAKLAERHDRQDLLSGVDLSGQSDRIAAVLMDMARVETAPRTDALADAIVWGLKDSDIALHRRARETASFSVLKSPDIPAVLLEIGFLSSPSELAKLTDPAWRSRAAAAIVRAVIAWEAEDRARAPLVRQ
ncbi:N-acetylmuramoyl-L-alanine amidase [Alphaproteobacteria bacterium KMM 3653]|uniref:N-acetylmuramoyl-L-alanine amidase n=1 Tax=Harenicola maris TaxID=2841044 RepID=A0AAP2G6N6_9RHOB|nr:N-acetylmuramoyl-L-alanine amidase [Harenicola maris]